MSSLAEIEAAVEALPTAEQQALFRHLAERLGPTLAQNASLPLVPASGRPITKQEIDDAVNAD